MPLVMIFTSLVVILEGMERAADVVFDLCAIDAPGWGGRWIDRRAGRIEEPLPDVETDSGISGRLVDHERRIELHLQLAAHAGCEHERSALERANHANALSDEVGIRRVELRGGLPRWGQLRFQLGESASRKWNGDYRMERIVNRHVDENRVANDLFAPLLSTPGVIIVDIVVFIVDFTGTVRGAGAVDLDLPKHELHLLQHKIISCTDYAYNCDPLVLTDTLC